MIEFIKIYGERNTGTNFLDRLFEQNFTATMLAGTLKERGAGEGKQRKVVKAAVKGHDHIVRFIVQDRFETLIDANHIAESFGWKHASPPVAFLKTVPERTAKTLFVVAVKHPVYWARSFHSRPYHSYFRTEKMEFSDFLRHIFIPSGRENVDAAFYRSAVELYAAKADGYRQLAGMGVPFELIRYEEFLGNVEGALKRIEEKHGLGRARDDYFVRDQSTKSDSTTLSEYREKYRLDRVRDAVAPEDYDFIVETFGEERLSWLGYED